MNRLIKLLRGQSSIPLSFEKNLGQNQSEKIKNISICREPIQSVISSILNQASGGELEKRIKQRGYDELFHLFMIITLESGKRLRLEKNQRPILEEDQSSNLSDCMYVEKTIGITLGKLIEKALVSMGTDKFVRYDAFKNNCQDFLLRVLSSNGLSSPELRLFIKQDAEDLLDTEIQKASKLVTDIAGVASDIRDIYVENKDQPVVQAVEEILRPSKIRAQSWAQSISDIFIKGVEDVFGGLSHKGSVEPDLVSILEKGDHYTKHRIPDIEQENK